MPQVLSKSSLLQGTKCEKSLWLSHFQPQKRPPLSEARKILIETEKEVGEYARKLISGGKHIPYEKRDKEKMEKETLRAIEEGATILYNPFFRWKGLSVTIDILKKNGKAWDIYTVKSAGGNKGYSMDIAIQLFVLLQLGYTVSHTFLMHINTRYTRKGKLDLHQLFKIRDLTKPVKETLPKVFPHYLSTYTTLSEEMPEVEIGKQCKSPSECRYFSHCWDDIPPYSVFNIAGLHLEQKIDLYKRGIVHLKDIPKDENLTEHQWLQIKTEHPEFTGKTQVKKKELVKFLKKLSYPLYFLDFETYQLAIPPFENLRPYQQIPFQYSLHFIDTPQEDIPLQKLVQHREFLAEEGEDPRETLVLRLIEDIPENVSVLAYDMSFEKGVIADLAHVFPQYSKKLMNIHKNMFDLLLPFKKKLFYKKEMKGSASIKYVLPALVPGLSYDNLNISNGDQARLAYTNLHKVKDPEERKQIREDLLEYCKLDTYAMVLLLQEIISITARN